METEEKQEMGVEKENRKSSKHVENIAVYYGVFNRNSVGFFGGL